MNLVDILEQHLGIIEVWPSSILTYLFHDHPSPVRCEKLKKVIAFCYWNDVPHQLAYQFYNACNGTSPRFVLEQFHSWYRAWHISRCRPHMAMYWNMRPRKYMFVNGSLLNQSEPVLPEVPQLLFGIDNAAFPSQIRDKLELVRLLKWYPFTINLMPWWNKGIECVRCVYWRLRK